MMHHFRITFIFALTAVAIAAAKTVFNSDERAAGETERIIGGQNAREGQFPWTVALYYNGQFICTASIISPNTVLTAAHCVIFNGTLQPADLFRGIANNNRSAGQVQINFENIIPHPEYDEQALKNDIALLTTTEPIAFGGEGGLAPTCIAGPEGVGCSKAIAMGWGNTQRHRLLPPNIPEILQHVQQKIVPNSLCTFINPGIDDDKICAKGLNLRGFTGICNGDSGGPLVCQVGDRSVQIGIASYINALVGCGKVAPGVWTKVATHFNFILENAPDYDKICVVSN